MSSEIQTVFVVDDDVSVRRALARLLRSEGFHVETFQSGRDFVQAVAQARRGCVVLDVRMPGMSGFDVLESLAAGGASLPVILISGDGDIPTAVRAVRSGRATFLTKPCDDRALLDSVRHALGQHDCSGVR